MLFLYSSRCVYWRYFPLLVIFLQLAGINLHLFQYVGNGFSIITIQSWRNIDVVAGVMKDRCLRGNFVCLSLAENVHKKILCNLGGILM